MANMAGLAVLSVSELPLAAASKRLNRSEPAPPPPVQRRVGRGGRRQARDCETCGRRFNPASGCSKPRFCSRVCAAAVKTRPTLCQRCGIAVPRVDGHARQLCATCRMLPKPAKPPKPRIVCRGVCAWCLEMFESTWAGLRYCSKVCQQRAHTRAHHLRRRGLKKTEVISLPAIFSRDRGLCGLCGKRVNRRWKPNDSRAATLDHIVPISLGGRHESANVQLAHFGCNSAKRARICGSQLRLIG
jgi:hypothetical protein